ncbi:hypothetical protein BGZ99_008463, partial [Dissophora globulifera]
MGLTHRSQSWTLLAILLFTFISTACAEPVSINATVPDPGGAPGGKFTPQLHADIGATTIVDGLDE